MSTTDGHFITCEDDTILCNRCAEAQGIDLSDPDVEVWEEGSDGWTGPLPPCRVCGKPTHVLVNRNQAGDDLPEEMWVET